MKTGVLYGSYVQLTPLHRIVQGTRRAKTASGLEPDSEGNPNFFIRMDIVNDDVGPALDRARPMKGEFVINSIPL
jgi:hypothetical protein